jgi:Flp pilus assembly protein TadG
MSRKCNSLSAFISACHGTAAVEFAFIVPVLTLIVLTISDVTTIATGVGEMHTAARAAIQYAMNGGTDMTVAKTQATDAWQSEPKDGTMSVVQACTCSGSSHTCSTTCSDGSSPYVFITATATGTLGGSMIKRTRTVTETVRQK